MKKLKLKSRYEGLRVTRSDIRIGKITFDANTVKPEHYQNYYDLGFTELFETIEVCDKCNNCTNGECVCEKQEQPKKVNEITKELYEDKMVKPSKVWYNNGKTNRRYHKGEQPEGWELGKVKKDK